MFANEEVMMEAFSKEELIAQAQFLNTLLDILSQFQNTYIDGCDRTGVFSQQIVRHFRSLESEVFTSLAEVQQYIENKKDKEDTNNV